MSQSLLDRLSALATIFACVTIGGVVLYRGFDSRGRVVQVDVNATPRALANWQRLEQHGASDGPDSAAIRIIEFSDLECPYCKQFHRNVEDLRSRYDSRVAVTFIHYPIKTHRFAAVAAQGAECAKRQGAFFQFVSRTFRAQDSLGLKSWAAIAREAGIADTVAFIACQSGAPAPAIAEGRRVGDSIGVKGTPTVVVNGFLFPIPPDSAQLDSLARAGIERATSARRTEARR